MERIIIKEKAVNYKVMGLLLFYLFSFLPLSAQTKSTDQQQACQTRTVVGYWRFRLYH